MPAKPAFATIGEGSGPGLALIPQWPFKILSVGTFEFMLSLFFMFAYGRFYCD